MTKRFCAFTLKPLLLLSISCSGGGLLQAPLAPTPRENPKLLVAWAELPREDNGAQGELLAPDEVPMVDSATSELHRALVRLESMVDDETKWWRSKHVRSLVKGKLAVERAVAQFGSSGDVGGLFDALTKASRALEGTREDTVPVRAQLVAVARSVSARLIELAARAGSRHELLAAARAEVASADRLESEGFFASAISKHGRATGIGLSDLRFDIERFERNLQQALAGQTVGHAYAIVENGQLHSSSSVGAARTSTDPPQTAQSPNKEMYLASMSKTLSAVALLKALDQKGVSLDAPIAPFLRDDWTQGPGVASLTFRHLLAHRSGLDAEGVSSGTFEGQTLEALRTIVAKGSTGVTTFNQAVYTNANYSLLRALIPRVLYGDFESSEISEEDQYAALYSNYVKQAVLGPAGVSVASCQPEEPVGERTLYYSFGSPQSAGADHGNWILACGATGWYLSAVELARFLAFLRYTDAVIDEQDRSEMDSGFLGWLNPVKYAKYVDGAFGPYRAHGGDFKRVTGCAMNYPTPLQATLLVNSTGGALGGHACEVLKDSYDSAWVGI